MSLVLACSRGILARMSPAWTRSPCLTSRWAPEGQEVLLQQDRAFLAVLVLGLADRVEDLDPGLHLLVLGLDDDLAHEARDLVLGVLHRHLPDDVLEVDDARLLGQDEGVEGIPFGEDLPGLDLLPVVDEDLRPVGDLIVLDLPVPVVHDGDVGRPVDDDEVTVLALDGPDVVEAEAPVVLGLEARLLLLAHGDAADVERPHRQLRAGLADGLGGDDADRLAELDEVAARPCSGRSRAGRRRAWPRTSGGSGS